jgi:prepilin-type N-terminal cleavage/methylation domain-containing protein
MKRKGFTLVELLVVISIIALLMSILMPALAMVRKMAQRAVCGSNLSGIHKAIMAYAQDNGEDYPRAGGKSNPPTLLARWGATTDWKATNTPPEVTAFNEVLLGSPFPTGTYGAGHATIGASLYLLIKWADVSPKSFICKGDKGAKIFSLAEIPNHGLLTKLQQAFDFGPITDSKTGMDVAQYYSYAYQIPYVNAAAAFFQLSSSSPSGLPVLADRSPYLVLSPDATRPAYIFHITASDAGKDQDEKWGNSTNHDNEGQNVLFNDGAVSFNNVPYCGVNNDNIYTMAPTDASKHKESGSLPGLSTTGNKTPLFDSSVIPQSALDSLLVNEGAKNGLIGPEKP